VDSKYHAPYYGPDIRDIGKQHGGGSTGYPCQHGGLFACRYVLACIQCLAVYPPFFPVNTYPSARWWTGLLPFAGAMPSCRDTQHVPEPSRGAMASTLTEYCPWRCSRVCVGVFGRAGDEAAIPKAVGRRARFGGAMGARRGGGGGGKGGALVA